MFIFILKFFRLPQNTMQVLKFIEEVRYVFQLPRTAGNLMKERMDGSDRMAVTENIARKTPHEPRHYYQ